MNAKCACKILDVGGGLVEQASRMDRWQSQNYDFVISCLTEPKRRKELDDRWTEEIVNPYHKAVAGLIGSMNDACGTEILKPESEPPAMFVDDPEDYVHELLKYVSDQLEKQVR